MSESYSSLISQIKNETLLNNLASHNSTSYIKWETRNGKWETRSGKWEMRNLEVGYGKGLNWAPRNGKWEPNQNSRLWRFALRAALLQETRPSQRPPSFLPCQFKSSHNESARFQSTGATQRISYGCLKSRTLQEISHVSCLPIAGPLCLGPTMEWKKPGAGLKNDHVSPTATASTTATILKRPPLPPHIHNIPLNSPNCE